MIQAQGKRLTHPVFRGKMILRLHFFFRRRLHLSREKILDQHIPQPLPVIGTLLRQGSIRFLLLLFQTDLRRHLLQRCHQLFLIDRL